MSVIDITSNLLTNPANPYKTRDLAGVDTIVVHQTDGFDKGEKSAYDVAKYHVNDKGWGGIAYHLFVTDDGNIYKTNNLETKSYHSGNYNTRSVGITVTGKHRYDPSKSNEEIIGTLKYRSLVKAISKTLGDLPNKDINIIAHSDISANRSDPNLNMDQLREDVKKKKSLVEDNASGSGNNNNTDSDVSDSKDEIRTYLKTIHNSIEKIGELL